MNETFERNFGEDADNVKLAVLPFVIDNTIKHVLTNEMILILLCIVLHEIYT